MAAGLFSIRLDPCMGRSRLRHEMGIAIARACCLFENRFAWFVSNSEKDILSFIAASFPSIWTLELLLVLKSERRPWSHAQLVETLRASDFVVSKAVGALVAAGLASAEGATVEYLPVSSQVDDCVKHVEDLYRKRPNAVRRVIISAGVGSATAFANAFRIREGGQDD